MKPKGWRAGIRKRARKGLSQYLSSVLPSSWDAPVSAPSPDRCALRPSTSRLAALERASALLEQLNRSGERAGSGAFRLPVSRRR